VTVILSDKDVREIADMPAVVRALDRGLRAEAGSGAVLPERMNLAFGETMLRVMPAILPGAGVVGLKFFYGTMPGGIRYSVIVADLATGEVLACVDAAYLTALRTGATSGVATGLLARADSRTVGLVGSGLEAETNLAAVCAVRGVTSVRVFSRDPGRREAFARRMAPRLGVEIEPVASPEEAVAGRDIVVVATNTGRGGDVAYRGAWMEPGQHVVSIGSTASFLRELDTESFLRPDVVVLDAPHTAMRGESGDVAALLEREPGWAPTALLADALTGPAGRSSAGQITLFKSVGTAAQDLIAAQSLYRLACEQGRGLTVPDLNEPKQF